MKIVILFALAVVATAYPSSYTDPPPVNIIKDGAYASQYTDPPMHVINDEVNLDTRTCRIPDVNDLNVDPEDTPSPLTVNECLENGLESDAGYCPILNCPNDCILPDLDGRGCLVSCSCKTSGLWGDIMLTESDVATIESNRAGSRHGKRWTSVIGQTKDRRKVYVIYYTFASSITSNPRAMNAINEAREGYYKDTCILFHPKPSGYSGDYIQFFQGSGCYSSLGRMGRGMQKISIGRGCEYKGIVMHEMMHSMGFWHEQARPDRDNYVKIKWENIQNGRSSQFSKIASSRVNSFGSSYDMGSIMQYGGMSFSKNGRPTIVDKKTGKSVEGQRRGFSPEDIKQLRAMYNCDNMP